MRARDKDRDAAVDQVRAAYDAGLIIAADRDLRIDQIRAASTTQDIELAVRDLALRAADRQPDQPVPSVASAAPPGPRPAAPVQGSSRAGKVVLVVLAVFFVLAFVVPLLFFFVVLVIVRTV